MRLGHPAEEGAGRAVRLDVDRDGEYDDWGYGDDLTSGDTTPPGMTQPPDITVSANIGATGVVRVYCSPPVASDGSQALTVRCTHAPGSEFPVGATTVTCRATDDGGNTTTRTFTVTVVSDTSAAVPTASTGDPVVIVASGFAPLSPVSIRFQSDPVFVGRFFADAEGRVALTVTVPPGLAPGPHDVIVEGVGPDGEVRQFVQPVVVAGGSLPETGSRPHWPVGLGLGLLAFGFVGLAASRRPARRNLSR